MTTSSERWMEQFERSAWRLETLPQYNPRTDASYQHWLAIGEPLPLEQRPRKREWMAAIRSATAAGKRLTQLHVVDRPLAPGVRYELAVYGENVKAGMEIRIADRTDHPELAALTRDWWGFDLDGDRPVIHLMTYDADGEYLSREVSSDPEVVARCRAEQDVALRYSVDLSEYLQRIA
jgi:hypothetical protein